MIVPGPQHVIAPPASAQANSSPTAIRVARVIPGTTAPPHDAVPSPCTPHAPKRPTAIAVTGVAGTVIVSRKVDQQRTPPARSRAQIARSLPASSTIPVAFGCAAGVALRPPVPQPAPQHDTVPSPRNAQVTA